MRVVSYLSPGLPEGLFEDIGRTLESALERRVAVEFVTETSGPPIGAGDPLRDVDLAFVCAPSLVELRNLGWGRLVPIAPVFDDPRNGGRPIYHSDVVVRSDHDARTVADLADAAWAVNDERSLSGYRCVLDAMGDDVSRVWSGGHLRSIELVRDGIVDAAAIDAHVLRRLDISGLRVVHTFGPHPVQPIVAGAGFHEIAVVVGALKEMAYPRWGVVGFGPVGDEDYPDGLD